MVINVTGAEFETEVLKAEGSVLVDFWGITCQHCKALMPYVEELAAEKGDLKIVKVESKANRDLCVEHMVMTLPTFILFRGGEEVERIAGKSIEEDDISDLAAKA